MAVVLLLSFGTFLPTLGRIPNVKGLDLCLLSSANSITLSLTCVLKDTTPPELNL
jgi:hypothetical protein